MKCSGLNGWLLDELRRFTLGPRIVSDTEANAIRNGGVIEEQKHVHGIRIGVDEDGFAVDLEGARKGLTCVRNNAMGNFQAVHIGLVLLRTAEGIADGVGCKTEESNEQKKRGKRGQIVEGADAPGGAGAREKRANGAIAKVEKNEKHCRKEQKSLPDVTEDIVAHFVAEIGKHFVGGFLRESGIPNDDALGSAEAVDGSVGGDGFVAGLHPEHAFWGNFHSGAAGDALKFGDEIGGLGGKRF